MKNNSQIGHILHAYNNARERLAAAFGWATDELEGKKIIDHTWTSWDVHFGMLNITPTNGELEDSVFNLSGCQQIDLNDLTAFVLAGKHKGKVVIVRDSNRIRR